jgi:hypothetical protein
LTLSAILRALKENPEDLTPLAQAIELAEELEGTIATQTEQIGKLQENYRKAIAMIPVLDPEPEPEKATPPEITIDDAVNALKNYMKEEL